MTEGKLSCWGRKTWNVDLGGDGRESDPVAGSAVGDVMAGDLGSKGSEGCRARTRARRQRRTRNSKREQRPARSSVPESLQSLILRNQDEGESRAGGRWMLTDCELGWISKEWVELWMRGGPVPP